MKAFLIAGVLTCIAVFVLAYIYLHKESQSLTEMEITVEEKVVGIPTFTWSYKSSTIGDIPQTEISLTAKYEDGNSVTKVIDTVEGNCNEYEDADADTYERSSMIICYYAGLGRYFKVVADGAGYTVLRKIFEEASPEYDPPTHQYEAIASF